MTEVLVGVENTIRVYASAVACLGFRYRQGFYDAEPEVKETARDLLFSARLANVQERKAAAFLHRRDKQGHEYEGIDWQDVIM